MKDKIKHAPLLANPREDPLELTGFAYIAGDDYRTGQSFADRAHVWLRLGIKVSNRQLRAGLMESFRAAIGDAVHVRDTHDQSAFFHKRHYFLFSMASSVKIHTMQYAPHIANPNPGNFRDKDAESNSQHCNDLDLGLLKQTEANLDRLENALQFSTYSCFSKSNPSTLCQRLSALLAPLTPKAKITPFCVKRFSNAAIRR